MQSKSQTLITGVYRTGSEYVTKTLDAHPCLSATMYRVNALRFLYDKFDPIDDSNNVQQALGATRDRIWQRYAIELNLDDVSDRLAQAERITYGYLYDAIMSSLYIAGNVKHWAEKNQLLWREIPKFLGSVPAGRALLVLRDPRSVLISFKKYTYASPPRYLEAAFNCLDAMRYAREYSNGLSPEAFRVIKYEDFAGNPANCSSDLWEWMNLSPEAHEPDAKDAWEDAYGNVWRANSSFHANDNPEAFDVEAAINRWKGRISADELGFVETVCGSEMELCGYPPRSESMGVAKMLEMAGSDGRLREHILNWEKTGAGIEAFPTDPTVPANWEERQHRGNLGTTHEIGTESI